MFFKILLKSVAKCGRRYCKFCALASASFAAFSKIILQKKFLGFSCKTARLLDNSLQMGYFTGSSKNLIKYET